MDIDKSLKIATRRFQNGNYQLSLKNFRQARKEFEVAQIIYEKTGSFKELAETLNNIGIAMLRDGNSVDAREFLERSYLLKKEKKTATNESMFNTLYNLLSISGILTPDEFESYFIELKAIGETLGGDHAEIVNREKAIYDSVVEMRAKDLKKKQEEEMARSSPAGALEHLVISAIPCVVRVDFVIHGIAVDLSEPLTYLNRSKHVSIEKLTHVDDGHLIASTGTLEFEAPYASVKHLMDPDREVLPEGEKTIQGFALDHIKKFTSTIALIREDLSYILSGSDFYITGIAMKNSFGDIMELYRGNGVQPVEPLKFNSEDSMLLKMMLTTEPHVYRMILLNARRLLTEELYPLSIIESITGFDLFLNLLLRSSLNADHLLDYTSIDNPGLYERIDYLKRLLSGKEKGETEGSLEDYLGDTGASLEEVFVYYDRIMIGDKSGIEAHEAEKALKAVNRTIIDLKAKYGV